MNQFWPVNAHQYPHPLKPFEQSTSYEAGADSVDYTPVISPLKMPYSPKFNKPHESPKFRIQAKVNKKAKII